MTNVDYPGPFEIWYDREQRKDWVYHAQIPGSELPRGRAQFLVYDQYTNRPVGRVRRSLDKDTYLRREWQRDAAKRTKSKFWRIAAQEGLNPPSSREPFFHPDKSDWEELRVSPFYQELDAASLIAPVLPQPIESAPAPVPRPHIPWDIRRDLLINPTDPPVPKQKAQPPPPPAQPPPSQPPAHPPRSPAPVPVVPSPAASAVAAHLRPVSPYPTPQPPVLQSPVPVYMAPVLQSPVPGLQTPVLQSPAAVYMAPVSPYAPGVPPPLQRFVVDVGPQPQSPPASEAASPESVRETASDAGSPREPPGPEFPESPWPEFPQNRRRRSQEPAQSGQASATSGDSASERQPEESPRQPEDCAAPPSDLASDVPSARHTESRPQAEVQSEAPSQSLSEPQPQPTGPEPPQGVEGPPLSPHSPSQAEAVGAPAGSPAEASQRQEGAASP